MTNLLLFLTFSSLSLLEISGTSNVDIHIQHSNFTETDARFDRLSRRTLEQFDYGPKENQNFEERPKSDVKVPLKSPRDFAGYEGYFNDRFSNSMDSENSGWSPYSVQSQKDTMFDSDSNIDWNIQKRDNNVPVDPKGSYQFPQFGNDYADMMMMMQVMKKMDSSPHKSGLLTRILDNPTTLVMITFIPISLLLAAAIPFVTNIMMNGITIPPLIPTTASKARSFQDSKSLQESPIEDSLPILLNLIDFGSRYMDNPDCLNRIFCEMTSENASDASRSNYLRRAFDTATLFANDDLLETVGVKSFVNTIRNGKCEQITCVSMSESSKSDLKVLMNDIMFKHSQRTRPKKR